MKKPLSLIIDKLYKKELELLYGEGTQVKINHVTYSTNKKNYIIDCVLYVADLSLFQETQLDGINYIIEESWIYTGLKDYKPLLLTRLDIIQDKPQ
jgi:hypothetical protein